MIIVLVRTCDDDKNRNLLFFHEHPWKNINFWTIFSCKKSTIFSCLHMKKHRFRNELELLCKWILDELEWFVEINL